MTAQYFFLLLQTVGSIVAMVPFFYLHAELDKETGSYGHNDRIGDGSRHPTTGEARSGTCLSLFGKDETGGSVILRLRGYRIHFYVSFRDAKLSYHCCNWLALHDTRVVSIRNVSGYKSMLIDRDHQISAAAEDYADTRLSNVYLMHVRTRSDVAAVVAAIDKWAREYYSTAARNIAGVEYSRAVRFYESNLDAITTATRRMRLDACRWACLNTSLCKETSNDSSGGGDREYIFYDNGAIDPVLLFPEDRSNDADRSYDSTFRLVPLVKVMSFDIECLSSDAETMPDAGRDPIIQISTVVTRDALGGDKRTSVEGEGPLSSVYSLRRHLFTTGGACDPIPGVVVQAMSHERDMLRAFVDHVSDEDPDIITGYNINSFDLPYLFDRFRANGVSAPPLGKRKTAASCLKGPFSNASRQYSSFIPKTHVTRIPGRVIFDMYTHMRKETSLRSYTLNSVSAHFLGGKKKDDIGYREIPQLYSGGVESRARLGRYCVKDAQLVLEIAFETQTFVHAFERCKVFRTMLQYMIDRGQQARFYSMLLAWCSPLNVLVNDVTTRQLVAEIPIEELVEEAMNETVDGPVTASSADASVTVIDSAICVASERRGQLSRMEKNKRPKLCEKGGASDTESEEGDDLRVGGTTAHGDKGGRTKRAGYDGATVLDPISGMYSTPVICLDYASLYPSIMIAYNLCFTTLVSDERIGAELAGAGLAERSPVGHYFLTRDVKKGVLPSILEMLLEERAAVRKRMSSGVAAAGTVEYRMLDGQQGALKLAANSIYGAIGCDKSVLHFVQIPSSVTAYGRRLIALTKEHVETDYVGTRVVYGDTDSVMVNLEFWDSQKQRIWECAAIGKTMAASTTAIIGRPPIRLQFETVYRPFLLCTKKRYAAGVYNDLDRMAAEAATVASGSDSTPPPETCRPTLKYKGLQVVRRDNCTFATRLMKFTLETLMDGEGDAIRRITDGLRAELSLLFNGRVNTKELVISKEWKRMCVNSQPHDTVARRMQERDPNSAPHIGDRVPYIVVTVPMGARLSDRAEDPLYAVEHGLSPDYLYYADNQVAKPVADLLRVVLPDRRTLEEVKDLFWPVDAPRRETDRRARCLAPGEKSWMKRVSIGNHRLTDYYELRHTGRSVDTVTARRVVCESEQELADVEDLLDGLAGKCIDCKNGDVESVRSCRNRECETLFDRYGKLDLRRRAMERIERMRGVLRTDGGGPSTAGDVHTPVAQRSSGVEKNRRYLKVFNL